MPSKNRKLGDLGEKIAGKWLEDRGFKIIDRNYLKKWGEIDLIAKKGSVMRFIEVKSISCDLSAQTGNLNEIGQALENGRGSDNYRPEDNVHPKKLQRLFRTIETYLAENDEEGEWQLDVVTVYLDMDKKTAKVSLLENIIG
jgi:Holliday junction resolvase-like predicted endonuclease